MSRGLGSIGNNFLSFPRTRGDEPCAFQTFLNNVVFSPHTRG